MAAPASTDNSREQEEEGRGEGHPRGQLSALGSGRISELASIDQEPYHVPSDLTFPQSALNALA